LPLDQRKALSAFSLGSSGFFAGAGDVDDFVVFWRTQPTLKKRLALRSSRGAHSLTFDISNHQPVRMAPEQWRLWWREQQVWLY
jgi:hypothetical protein